MHPDVLQEAKDNFESRVWATSVALWVRWRVGLAVGKMLRRSGGVIVDAGWRMINRAALEVDRRVRAPRL